MIRTLVTLAAGIGVGVAGTIAAQHEGVKVTTLAARDIVEKLDGKKAKATTVEVTLGPGESDAPHRRAIAIGPPASELLRHAATL